MSYTKGTTCPLGRIARGSYSCDNNCALYYNNECLIRTCLLNLTGIRQKETEEKILKLQKDLQFTGLFGGLPIDYYTKGSEPNGN